MTGAQHDIEEPRECRYCGHVFETETYWAAGKQRERIRLETILDHWQNDCPDMNFPYQPQQVM